MPDIKDLTFLRLIIAEAFHAIPTRLFESIKELTPEMIERIYKYSAEIMTYPCYDRYGNIISRVPNPSVWVAVMQDIGREVKGFIWLEFDVIDQRVFVQATAVDPEYQTADGSVLANLIGYIKTLHIAEEMKNNIQFVTHKPKAYEKIGCVRSKKILMELKDEPAKSDDKGPQERDDNTDPDESTEQS